MADSNNVQGTRWQVLEFALVVVMLGILTLLVGCILLTPRWDHLNQPALPTTATVQEVVTYREQTLSYQEAEHEYRKDVLAVILAAFGAWVGAGAAYFFGRESLRDATSLLRDRDVSPKERLNRTKIGELPLKPLELVVKLSDPIQPIVDRLKADNKLWFVTVVNEQGQLLDVMHKEGIWRYVVDNIQGLASKSIDNVRTYLEANESLKRSSLGIYVPVKLDMTVGQAHDELTRKEVYLGMVVGADNRPMQYFDTADVRRFLLTER